ncbi:phosphotransferase family protein [Deinococcus roseus]|uniref:CHK kinase-like domain-containing protein n=1 Tax=Deinococcus roseus TaxID=392414 RepID=A0ABQ2CYT9_9DEIO|nr:phosphotransferase [Deinococcus roseus]GGJ34105.1 hypothetical protein GCM10008938_20390 [Deinococcus roseus]
MGGQLSTLLQRLGVVGEVVRSLLGQSEPITCPVMLKPALKAVWPDLKSMEVWKFGEGERADYASVRLERAGGSEEVFVKYRPMWDFSPRHHQRFLNEILYLREFAPLVNIPHAALKGAQHNSQTFKAHLILENLESRCMQWSDLPEPERFARVNRVVELLASFHAQWMLHPSLKKHPSHPWGDHLPRLLQKHRTALKQPPEGIAAEMRNTVLQLLEPGRLEEIYAPARHITLCHGDFHFGQVLVDRLNRDRLYLIDYEHTAVTPLGFDLAHFLGVRFNWFERTHLEAALLDGYLHALQQHGVLLSREELLQEYRVGLLHNFLLMWSRCQKEPIPMFHELLQRLWVALQEHQVLQPAAVLR